MRLAVAHYGAIISLTALIFLCLGWELVWAPLRPGGSFFVLKVLPLLLPLFGILRGRRYTYQWSAMLILLYFAEGIVRAASDAPPASRLALLEVALSLVFLFSASAYARLAAPRR
ncbi:DUF2069 domain-containing protein [Thiobacter aerophilum]|uniref:DUF2069 domain-containing protein n=1 Tax=Thiobacter aerophilum TaxID=3121275 RepID=A0ABV0EFQ5_9BURK